MQGPVYVDTLQPIQDMGEPPTVNLTTSNQVLIPTQYLPNLGANFFGYAGRAVRVRVAGRLTTAATPGNFNWLWYFGNNTASNGANVTSLGSVMTANWTAYSWIGEWVFRARSVDPNIGQSMIVTGWLDINGWGMIPFPFTGPTAVSISSYATNPLYLSLQMNRTGSTAETIRVHDINFEALN